MKKKGEKSPLFAEEYVWAGGKRLSLTVSREDFLDFRLTSELIVLDTGPNPLKQH